MLTQKFEKFFSSIFINTVRTLFGFCTFLLFALILDVFPLIFQLPIRIWLILMGSILFTVIIGDTLFFLAQKQIGTVLTLGITTIYPIFTYFLALVYLDDSFSWHIVLSILLIGLGIQVLTRNRPKHNPKKEIETPTLDPPVMLKFSVFSHTEEKTPLSLQLSANMTSNSPNSLTPAENLILETQSIVNIMEQNSRHSIKKGLIYSILCALFWAMGIIFTDIGMNLVDDLLNTGTNTIFLTNVIRYFFASVVLLLLSFHKLTKSTKSREDSDFPQKRKQAWKELIISSVIGVAIGSYFFGEAARLSGATILAIVSTALPLFAIPFSYLINHEKVTGRGVFGILLTISGVIISFF